MELDVDASASAYASASVGQDVALSATVAHTICLLLNHCEC